MVAYKKNTRESRTKVNKLKKNNFFFYKNINCEELIFIMSSLSINSNLESNDSSAYNFVRPPILHSVKDLETDLSLYRDLFKIND